MGYPVLIVDDHLLFSTSLRLALCDHGLDAHQIKPESYAGILARAAEITPGLVVLDLELGTGTDGQPLRGSQVVPALTEQGWKVLIVSGNDPDRPSTAAAIAAGAVGVVAKSSSLEELLHTVVRAASGSPVMTEAERQQWLVRDRRYRELETGFRAQERERNQRLNRLSRREREVLELLADGQRAAAIAERFVVSVTTVRTQIRSILNKLEVNSQLEAVAMVRQSAHGPR